MTIDPAEVAERSAFVDEVVQQLIPNIRSLPVYASYYFDQSSDGRAVILALDPGPAQAVVDQIAPVLSLPVEVREVDITEEQLERKARLLTEEIPVRFDIVLSSVAVDVIGQRIIVEVGQAHIGTAQENLAQIQALADPAVVELIEGEIAQTASCTSRDNCIDPLKAGNRVNMTTQARRISARWDST